MINPGHWNKRYTNQYNTLARDGFSVIPENKIPIAQRRIPLCMETFMINKEGEKVALSHTDATIRRLSPP